MSDTDKIDALFLHARTLSPEERIEFLELLEAPIRREVESLLSHDSEEDATPPLGRQVRELFDTGGTWTADLSVRPSPDSSAGSNEGVTRPIDPASSQVPRIDGITLEGVIGTGGQGVVYRGHQTYLKRAVAVKVLGQRGPQFAARFRREAQILAGLSHPNIVACHQAGLTETGDWYLVMELIEGPNLRHWLNRNGPLSVEDARLICRDLARALAHAHAAGIIHRDVKPENVLLVPRKSTGTFPFEVKLTDLGLARPQTRSESNAELHLTQGWELLGTPQTMAPEQFEDPDHVDHRTDIYGLGCLFYHMLTGQPAFRQPTIEATIARKMSPEPPNVAETRSDAPRPVVELVGRMLARDPDARPQSYAELIAHLEGLSQDPASPDAAPARRSTAWRRAIPLALVLALVIGWAVLSGDAEVRGLAPERANEGEAIALRVEDGGSRQLEWRVSSPGVAPMTLEADATFIAPEAPAPYVVVAELVDRTSGAVLDEQRIEVDADDDPPEVSLPAEQEAAPGESVTLSAEATDAEQQSLEFVWTQVRGGTVELQRGVDGRASFTVPDRLRERELVFGLTVSDGSHEIEKRVTVHVTTEEEPFTSPLDLIRLLLERGTKAGPGVWSAGEIHDGSLVCATRDSGELGWRLPAAPWVLRGSLHVMPEDGTQAGLRIEFDDRRAAILEVALGDDMASRVTAAIGQRGEEGWTRESSLQLVTLEKAVDADGVEEPATIDFNWSRDDDGLLLRLGRHGDDESTFREHRFRWSELHTDYEPGRLALFVQNGVACFCRATLTAH